jgi:hypothetical protein
LVPFLGHAYSRACERTCDRYGLALCGDGPSAIKGLCILAAGGRMGPQISVPSFVAQTRDLDTGWMTIGRWLSGYPPLAERVALLDPALAPAMGTNRRGVARASALLGGCLLIPVLAAAISMAIWWPKFKALAELGPRSSAGANSAGEGPDPVLSAQEIAARTTRAHDDLERIAHALEAAMARGETLDDDATDIEAVWKAAYGEEEMPLDPFDGARYGFLVNDGGALVWSSGPDGRAGTADDLDRPVPLSR